MEQSKRPEPKLAPLKRAYRVRAEIKSGTALLILDDRKQAVDWWRLFHSLPNSSARIELGTTIYAGDSLEKDLP